MGREPLSPSPLPSTLSRKPGATILTPLSSHSVSFAVENNGSVRKSPPLELPLPLPSLLLEGGAWDFAGNWYHVAPKPRGNEDLTGAHQPVVGAAAPASVRLLYERGQLLQSQAPLLFQVEKLWRGGRVGQRRWPPGTALSPVQPIAPGASQPVLYRNVPLSS